MSGHLKRHILVDDTDPRVVYSGLNNWFTDSSGVKNGIGNFGNAFNSTLHGSSTNGSFQFAFSGTSVEVFGFNDIQKTTAGVDPSWECFVDNAQIPSTKPFRFPEQNWKLCGTETLQNGSHTLVLNVNSAGQIFWFDYILYAPSNLQTLGNELVYVPEEDSDLLYDSYWEPLGEQWRMTKWPKSSVSFNFTGSKVSWYGMYPAELPHLSALSTYSVDGGRETVFSLNGPDGNTTSYHQLMFETPVLAQGQHSLVVKFEGDNNTTPLSLDYLIVQNAYGTNAASPTVSTNSRHRTNAAAIACGIIIPIFVIALLFLAYRLSRGRRRIYPAPAPRAFTLASPPPSPLPSARRRSRLPHIRTSIFNPAYWRRSSQSHSVRLYAPESENPPSRWKNPAPLDSASHSQELHYREMPDFPRSSPWKDSPALPDSAFMKGAPPGNAGLSRIDDPRSIINSIPQIEDDGDQSYYGGYQTKREIMAQEASARRSMVKEGQ